MADPVSAGVALGLSAFSTAQQASAASATRRVARARTRLDLARSARDGQQQLARTLARQNVQGGAQGINASSGSLMRQAMAARRVVRRSNGFARGAASLDDTVADQQARSRVFGSLISFGRAGRRFGASL
ncbi:MAG: hypothetical protein P1U37_09010 [Minwuia sp.]|nr:hypothetical protein [Minwuia sp.]